MATWQGSNGGLLAGIGGVNSNAPSVNDIGNTLQLIRQNNDIERSGANNVGLLVQMPCVSRSSHWHQGN